MLRINCTFSITHTDMLVQMPYNTHFIKQNNQHIKHNLIRFFFHYLIEEMYNGTPIRDKRVRVLNTMGILLRFLQNLQDIFQAILITLASFSH